MELKLVSYIHRLIVVNSFNRTFMELKFMKPNHFLNCFISFNRTFMELKYGMQKGT